MAASCGGREAREAEGPPGPVDPAPSDRGRSSCSSPRPRGLSGSSLSTTRTHRSARTRGLRRHGPQTVLYFRERSLVRRPVVFTGCNRAATRPVVFSSGTDSQDTGRSGIPVIFSSGGRKAFPGPGSPARRRPERFRMKPCPLKGDRAPFSCPSPGRTSLPVRAVSDLTGSRGPTGSPPGSKGIPAGRRTPAGESGPFRPIGGARGVPSGVPCPEAGSGRSGGFPAGSRRTGFGELPEIVCRVDFGACPDGVEKPHA
ncbi:MAG: hypothetical protein QG608_272 [Actinomycetota bacterium]|nr:hypothetical protein [Actinomycetota bacterium]